MTKPHKHGQRKTPILRFKGVTDDWEQRKLGKQNKITMGQSPSSKNYTDNPNDWILIQGNADLKNGKVTPRLYTSQVTKKADIGDIILTVRAPVGEVAITDYKAILGRGVASIKGNLFIYFALEKFKTNNKWNMYSSGSTFDAITGKDLNNLALFFPSKMEENKIGKLLNKLDSLLALYERKLKLLSQVKKYFLDNLFAEKEYPNLRFKGFTDACEQRELLKVCKKEDNKRIPIKEQERKEGNTPYFGANGIHGYIDGYTHDGTNILIAEDGANNVRNYPIKLITGKIWVNNHAHVLKVNTKINNGNFLVGVIKKINFYRYLVGSSRYKLTAESLNQVKIKIAKQSEQEKIGELLKNIEELLTLYENKQQHFTEIKKTLLNTMFI